MPERVYRFKVFLFIKKKEKQKIARNTCHFFIFLVKMELWKIGQQVCYFCIFSFFEHSGKNEKMVRINIIVFIFPFFYFWGKMEKQKKKVGNRRLFHFSHFSNNIENLKKSKISLLAVYTVFCIFEEDFKIGKNEKNDQFS